MEESARFQCNICFDPAVKPVTTPCGHLYCWGCIYNWLSSNQHEQNCPVCKSGISQDKLIPIYIKEDEEENKGEKLPERPRARWEEAKQNPEFIHFQRPRFAAGLGLFAGMGLFPGLGFHFTASTTAAQNDILGKIMLVISLLIILTILFH